MNVTDDTRASYAKKPRKKQPESELQIACVRWFRYQYPQLVLFAIANGGSRSKGESGILLAEGVMPGIPDLMLAVPRGEYGGLFIEMKILPNLPQPKQLAVMDRLVKIGYSCQVSYTLESFMQTVNDYLTLPMPAHHYIKGNDMP